MNESVRSWLDWRGWMVVGSAIVIVLSLAAILSPGFRDFIWSQTTSSWAAAIATGAAAIAAVWLGLREGAWRHEKNESDAAIFTALIWPEAEALIRQLEAVRMLHNEAQIAGLKRASTIILLEDARTIGTRPVLVETRRFVAQFGVLGSRRAAALARAIGTLGLLEEALYNAAHDHSGADETTELSEAGLRKSEQLLDRIQTALRIALEINNDEYEHILRAPIQGVMKRSERSKLLERSLNKLVSEGKIAR